MADRVIAVDPAALAPEVAALPNVTHLRMQSVAALADIRRLAPDGADLLARPAASCFSSTLCFCWMACLSVVCIAGLLISRVPKPTCPVGKQCSTYYVFDTD